MLLDSGTEAELDPVLRRVCEAGDRFSPVLADERPDEHASLWRELDAPRDVHLRERSTVARRVHGFGPEGGLGFHTERDRDHQDEKKNETQVILLSMGQRPVKVRQTYFYSNNSTNYTTLSSSI